MRLACAAIAWTWYAALALTKVAGANPTVPVDCGTEYTFRQTSPTSLVEISVEKAGLLRVDGVDQDFEPLNADPVRWAGVAVPPRLGTLLVDVREGDRLTLAPKLTGRPPGSVTARLDCTPQRESFDWLVRASGIARVLRDRAVGNDATTANDIAALRETANGQQEQALAEHLRAQLLYVQGKSAEAAEAFGVASQAWRDAGYPNRARAAHVGRIEDLMRVGQYAQALDEARDSIPSEEASDYFAIRQENGACLALQYLARLNESSDCFRAVLQRLDARGEVDEAQSTRQDFARLLHQIGNTTEAEEVVRAVLLEATALDNPVVMGRVRLTLGEFAAGRGALDEAISHFEEGLRQFERYRDPRWEANVLMRLAAVFASVGAIEEGYDFARTAMQRLQPGNAPARVAHALRELATVSREAQLFDEAGEWLARAEELFERLGLIMERDETRSERALTLLDAGERAQAVALLATLPEDSAGRSIRELAHAELDLHTGDVQAAERRLVDLGKVGLRADHAIRLVRLQARAKQVAGDCLGAEAVLFEAATQLRAAAHAHTNAVWAQLLLRRISGLRSDAVDLLMAPGSACAPDVAGRLWVWSEVDKLPPREHATGATSSAAAKAWDDAVAQELLAPLGVARSGSPQASDGKSLLALMQGETRLQRAAPVMVSIDRVRASLETDDMALTYLEGRERGAVVAVTGAGVSAYPAGVPKHNAELIETLRGSVASRTTAQVQIRNHAHAVRDALLGGLRAHKVPTRLLIDAGSPVAGVPWSVLSWFGEDAPLVGTTTVSLVRFAGAAHLPVAEPVSIELFVASREQRAAGLAALPGAESERGLVASSIPSRRLTLGPSGQGQREALLGALRRPGAWVHVAAHGATPAVKLGRSGIWLDSPAPGNAPAFVSWVDTVRQGVGASLVVLNACQLAASADVGISAELGFADAVSRAGAEHVVAAMWNVSDGATAIWVPAFYGALEEDAADVGAAVHEAQRALWRSTRFRHPFYWASVAHIKRAAVTTQANLSLR